MICAILHDLVEDKSEIGYHMVYLEKAGFNSEIRYILDLLDHKPSMSYMDYIRLLASNPIAKAIKLADLEHNSKITRLKGLRKKLLQKCISEELVNKHNSFLFFFI